MRTMMTILLAAMVLHAQDKPSEVVKPEPREAVIIPVKTLTGDSFNRLVRLLGVFSAPMNADEKLRTIVVYAPKDVVEQMRKVVNELDRPGSEAAIGRNIDMTMTFLKCSTKPASGASTLPADLDAVAPLHCAVGRDADPLLVAKLVRRDGEIDTERAGLVCGELAALIVPPGLLVVLGIFLRYNVTHRPAQDRIAAVVDPSGDHHRIQMLHRFAEC